MNAAYRVHRHKPVIFLFSRDKNRERTVVIVQNFRPYFFVPDDQSDIIDIFGRPVRKVYTELPSDVPKERQKYSFSDEADIQFFLRYLIDVNVRSAFEVQGGKEQISKTGIRCILVDHNVDTIVPVDDFEVPPKVLYFDIEVTSPTGIFPRPSDPRFPIASIQCSSNYHDRIDVFLLVDNPNLQKYVESNLVFEKYGHEVHLHPFDDDRLLLLSFVKFVQQEDPDVLTAYNGSLFDMPYLLRRAERLRISLQGMSPLGTVNVQTHRGFSDVYIKGRDFIDYFAAYRKWGTGRQGVQSDQPFGVTFDFKRVCAAEAGFYYEDLGDRVEEAMRTTPEEWVEYCINDAYALKLLDEKTGIIQHFDRLRRIVGVPISWSLSNKKLIDTEILRESDRPLPTMVPQEDAEVQGAIVKLPPPGVHENVACFDLKSIYPSVIISFNLSAETKDPKGEIFVTDYWRFKREPEGIIPKVTRKYMEERERLRALRKKLTGKEHDRVRQLETLYKFLACSIYGVNAYRYFRMFDPEVANAITYLGRLALTRCEKMLARNGYQVIYEDTDSLFVKMKTKLRREVNVVEYLLNEELRQFARIYGAKYPPVIKFERLFKRILFKTREKGKSAKKRYAGVDEKGNLYIIGFEPRRSSTAEITRTTMKKFFEKVLVEEDIDGAIQLVREVWQNLPKYPIQKVAVPKGLQKTVYKVKNPWIVGKEYAEKYFGKVFREDKKPRLVYVKQVIGKPPTHAICLTEDDTELPPGVIVDWKRMREVTIKKPFEGLLASIGYDFSVIEKGIQQQSLGRYLGGNLPK